MKINQARWSQGKHPGAITRASFILRMLLYYPLPIGSMYGIYANIWGILMINVTIYSIHGSYGLLYRLTQNGI